MDGKVDALVSKNRDEKRDVVEIIIGMFNYITYLYIFGMEHKLKL